ncbi:hypothetical protein OAG79_02030 [Akkermansiaceae bacterium]|nr:hypothetical protein [Akkermansiaceae bacterium]MDB4620047.1 hypothetical protein [Akkermansiaceae bacterium]
MILLFVLFDRESEESLACGQRNIDLRFLGAHGPLAKLIAFFNEETDLYFLGDSICLQDHGTKADC